MLAAFVQPVLRVPARFSTIDGLRQFPSLVGGCRPCTKHFSASAYSFSPLLSSKPMTLPLGSVNPVFYKENANRRTMPRRVALELIPFPATVEDVNGDLLWIGRAWIGKSDVYTVDQAFEHYSEQILNEPSALAYHKRAAVWQQKGDLDKAIDDCNESIKLDPTFAGAYITRGRALEMRATLTASRISARP